MKSLIVANWKCNPTSLKGAQRLFDSVKRGVENIKNVEVVICPPFVWLPLLIGKSSRQNVKVGAQDCFWEKNGAFTGEVSPAMLKNLGCQYVIVGHSERRALGETNEMINKKIRAALRNGLKPILCIDKISQIKKVHVPFSIAYEPLFAIGTGKACSPERAEKMRLAIKKKVNIPVLYGGSVNSQNAKDYIEKAGFQGLLVGGASLNASEFVQLVKNVSKT